MMRMWDFSPENVKALGKYESGFDYYGLHFDLSQEAEVVAAYEESGYRCVKDQDLIDRASGYRNHEERVFPS